MYNSALKNKREGKIHQSVLKKKECEEGKKVGARKGGGKPIAGVSNCIAHRFLVEPFGKGGKVFRKGTSVKVSVGTLSDETKKSTG